MLYFRRILRAVSKPVLYVASFFIVIYLINIARSLGFALIDFSSHNKLISHRETTTEGNIDLKFYQLENDPIVNRGTLFTMQIWDVLDRDFPYILSVTNVMVMETYHYTLDESRYFAALSDLVLPYRMENCSLSFIDMSEPLASGGRVFHFKTIHPSNTIDGEFQYAPEQDDLWFTIYFQGDEPVSFLPFAEPSLHSYANTFGFQ